MTKYLECGRIDFRCVILLEFFTWQLVLTPLKFVKLMLKSFPIHVQSAKDESDYADTINSKKGSDWQSN